MCSPNHLDIIISEQAVYVGSTSTTILPIKIVKNFQSYLEKLIVYLNVSDKSVKLIDVQTTFSKEKKEIYSKNKQHKNILVN